MVVILYGCNKKTMCWQHIVLNNSKYWQCLETGLVNVLRIPKLASKLYKYSKATSMSNRSPIPDFIIEIYLIEKR